MKDNRINAIIALATVLAALLMVASLSLAIGKWSFATNQETIVVLFPSAAGINVNSAVKFAGAPIGRVKAIEIIPRSEQTQDPITSSYNCVKVIAEVDRKAELGVDSFVTIKQDGLGLSAKYLLFNPGSNHNSELLADGSVIQGHIPFEISDLAQPAGETLIEAHAVLDDLKPVVESLDRSLPPLLNDLGSPDSRAKLDKLMTNLAVVTDNLKVVSSNSKALTETIANKPWRLFWGGPVVKPPPEEEVLKSDKAVPLHADVQVGDKKRSQTQETTTP